MAFLFYVKQVITNFLVINDAEDALEINDDGDVLLY